MLEGELVWINKSICCFSHLTSNRKISLYPYFLNVGKSFLKARTSQSLQYTAEQYNTICSFLTVILFCTSRVNFTMAYKAKLIS